MDMEIERLQERERVFITGASGAIGSALARKFASLGYNLILHYFEHGENLSKVVEDLQSYGVKIDTVQGNLASAEECQRLLADLDAKRYQIEILINNAGVSEWGLFTDLNPESWQQILEVNLSSVYRLSHAILPYMVQRKRGNIVNIASIWALRGASCEAAYSASKAGLVGLTRSLAREYGPSGIRVNALAPGVIESEMLARFSPEELQELASETPLFRLGKASEVAEAAAFLASPQASFITGACLVVDGGFTV